MKKESMLIISAVMALLTFEYVFATVCVSGTAQECRDLRETWTGNQCCVEGNVTCISGTSDACTDEKEHWTGRRCCVEDSECISGTVQDCTDTKEHWTGERCCVENAECNSKTIEECIEYNDHWTGNRCCTEICVSHSYSSCLDNDIYWFDSCGYREKMQQDCDDQNECTTDICTSNACVHTNRIIGTDCGVCASCNDRGECNIYDDAQHSDCSCPPDSCSDANSDGIVDAWNDYDIGVCSSINTCSDCGPILTEPDSRCQTAMKIPIDQGVSMFSLPLVPIMSLTFNDIQNGCTFRDGITQGIAAWDPLKTEEDKYMYLGANSILYPGQGYFTTQEVPCEFTIQGYKFTSKLLGYQKTNNIYNGWNMIGSPSDGINDFDLIENNCNVVSGPWGFDAPRYQFVRTQKLVPEQGYFVKTTNDCNLI